MAFSQQVQRYVQDHNPTQVLTTGFAPISAATLQELSACGTRVTNFSTDNPFVQPRHRSWFLEALPFYDTILNPRLSARRAFLELGCSDVRDSMFAYDPSVHFPALDDPVGGGLLGMAFVGYGDDDRAAYFDPLRAVGLNLRLYGGGWRQRWRFRKYAQGFASPAIQRQVYGGPWFSPCLVRRSNIDDHVMRTFEGPAMGACMAFEATPRHIQLFGSFLPSVCIFNDRYGLLKVARLAVGDRSLAADIRAGLEAFVGEGGHTYAARLMEIL